MATLMTPCPVAPISRAESLTACNATTPEKDLAGWVYYLAQTTVKTGCLDVCWNEG